jgi:hypothetical protein
MHAVARSAQIKNAVSTSFKSIVSNALGMRVRMQDLVVVSTGGGVLRSRRGGSLVDFQSRHGCEIRSLGHVSSNFTTVMCEHAEALNWCSLQNSSSVSEGRGGRAQSREAGNTGRRADVKGRIWWKNRYSLMIKLYCS